MRSTCAHIFVQTTEAAQMLYSGDQTATVMRLPSMSIQEQRTRGVGFVARSARTGFHSDAHATCFGKDSRTTTFGSTTFKPIVGRKIPSFQHNDNESTLHRSHHTVFGNERSPVFMFKTAESVIVHSPFVQPDPTRHMTLY